MNNLNYLVENILIEIRLDTKINLNDYNVKKETRGASIYYNFTVDTDNFRVIFEKDVGNKYVLVYERMTPKGYYTTNIDLEPSKFRISPTIVLKIVAKIVDNFIINYNPNIIVFGSIHWEGGSQVKLYDILSGMLIKKYPQYKLNRVSKSGLTTWNISK